MTTLIDINSMIYMQANSRGSLLLREHSNIGIYLCNTTVETVLYPGWRQCRIYLDAPFDIMGVGTSPNTDIVELWMQIDTRFNELTTKCNIATHENIIRNNISTQWQSSYSRDRILGASAHNKLYISAILFSNDVSLYSINLDYYSRRLGDDAPQAIVENGEVVDIFYSQ